jgi:hypothetical protein
VAPLALRPTIAKAKSEEKVVSVVKSESRSRTIAFLGDYLPRKCGIATFTSDLLGAVAARHLPSRCFAVPVSSGMKVVLPGVRGNISVNYVFTFLSILEFKAPETLLLALSSLRIACDLQLGRGVQVRVKLEKLTIFGEVAELDAMCRNAGFERNELRELMPLPSRVVVSYK